jgi:hypothetical protein
MPYAVNGIPDATNGRFGPTNGIREPDPAELDCSTKGVRGATLSEPGSRVR